MNDFPDGQKQEVLDTLRDWGVRNPEVGVPGEIPVTPGQREILRMNITPRNTFRGGVLDLFPRPPEQRFIGGQRTLTEYGGICGLLSCEVLELLGIECSKTVTNWVKPNIVGSVVPNEITEATAYLNPFNARIEGKVNAEFANRSEPGKKITQTKYKCKPNEPPQENVKEDSAVVDLESDNEFSDVGSGQVIQEVVHGVVALGAGNTKVSGEVQFQVSGALDVLKQIFNQWTTGTMRGQFSGTMVATYEWRGQERTKEFNVDVEARVPCNNLSYGW